MDSVAEDGSLATFSVRPEGASSSDGWTGMVVVWEFWVDRCFLEDGDEWMREGFLGWGVGSGMLSF